MKAFVLTDPQGQIRDREMLDLFDGYNELCIPTELITESKLYINPQIVTPNDIFCGHVNLCLKIIKANNVIPPESIDYPYCLQQFLGRKIKKMQLRDLEKILNENEEFGRTYFVKPIRNKLFTGFTCMVPKDLCKLQVSKSCEVYVSAAVNFVAEYRVYVYKNEIVDMYRYAGNDWKANADSNLVESMLELLKLTKMPIFYSIDVGVTDEKKTLLVEVNDGYALGNYGLGPKAYAEMSSARWKEIMESKN